MFLDCGRREFVVQVFFELMLCAAHHSICNLKYYCNLVPSADFVKLHTKNSSITMDLRIFIASCLKTTSVDRWFFLERTQCQDLWHNRILLEFEAILLMRYPGELQVAFLVLNHVLVVFSLLRVYYVGSVLIMISEAMLTVASLFSWKLTL